MSHLKICMLIILAMLSNCQTNRPYVREMEFEEIPYDFNVNVEWVKTWEAPVVPLWGLPFGVFIDNDAPSFQILASKGNRSYLLTQTGNEDFNIEPRWVGPGIDASTILTNKDIIISGHIDVDDNIDIDPNPDSEIILSGTGFTACIDPDMQPVWYDTSISGRLAVSDSDNCFYLADKDGWLHKLDQTGQVLWDLDTGFEIKGITLDDSSNICAVGLTRLDIDNPFEYYDQYGFERAILAKFDTQGSLIWTKDWGLTEEVEQRWLKPHEGKIIGYLPFGPEVYNVKVGTDGSIYVVEVFSMVVDFDPGPGIVEGCTKLPDENRATDWFLSKFSANGELIWVRHWGENQISGCTPRLLGSFFDGDPIIGLDDSGGVYITGTYFSSTDFDPGESEYNRSVDQGRWLHGIEDIWPGDIFICKYDSDGRFHGVETFDGPGYECPNGIYIDSENSIYLPGTFDQEIDFDPGEGENIAEAPNGAGFFLMKLTQ